MELRTSNVNPYKKALATYWNNGVKDYWRDGEKTMIIVLK